MAKGTITLNLVEDGCYCSVNLEQASKSDVVQAMAGLLVALEFDMFDVLMTFEEYKSRIKMQEAEAEGSNRPMTDEEYDDAVKGTCAPARSCDCDGECGYCKCDDVETQEGGTLA